MTQESQNIEFKSSWRDAYLKWVCGFANAQGGRIFVGRDDAGNVVGLPAPTFEERSGGVVVELRRPSVEAPVETPVKSLEKATGTDPVTAPVTRSVIKLLVLLAESGPHGISDLLEAFSLKSRRRCRETYVDPALAAELIERTDPDSPNSPQQKYRLTEKGKQVLASDGEK